MISNGSDACDQLRFAALQDDSLYEGDKELQIDLIVDTEAGTLTIRDNGVGMDREEVLENIGTIARSGTKAFLESLTGDQQADAGLIGQFGVDFYSAFIVADKVTLLTRKAGDAAAAGVRWESDGGGKFSIAAEQRPHHGTEVTLYLKEEEKSFLQSWTLRSLVKCYSDHIGFSIRMEIEETVTPDESAEGNVAEGNAAEGNAAEGNAAEAQAEAKTTKRWDTINQAVALWTLPKSEISDEEYQSFYQYVSGDSGEAQCWTHNKVEGSQSYTTL